MLRFFKDKRDVNIHREPVRPTQHASLSVSDHLILSTSVRLEIRNADGTIEVREPEAEEQQVPPQTEPAKVATRYVFDDWNGPECIIELTRRYLAALESFVTRGVSSGVISG